MLNTSSEHVKLVSKIFCIISSNVSKIYKSILNILKESPNLLTKIEINIIVFILLKSILISPLQNGLNIIKHFCILNQIVEQAQENNK